MKKHVNYMQSEHSRKDNSEGKTIDTTYRGIVWRNNYEN
jgi:hypothetical protein